MEIRIESCATWRLHLYKGSVLDNVAPARTCGWLISCCCPQFCLPVGPALDSWHLKYSLSFGMSTQFSLFRGVVLSVGRTELLLCWCFFLSFWKRNCAREGVEEEMEGNLLGPQL